ncbi:hypothetical protein J8J42_09770 [Chryseobacterium sp. cx-311]|uniref:hypothetical protein n=1 Tax=Marnyiella aurantia TaxID=2758037 RepID=UPI001AE8579D|nr:hypothetical protein [Marnyiella aurantia]MBP0613335.1 hypothetical protein [Marnyiella aurantia]
MQERTKKVALLIPHHFELYKAIISNLEKLGFSVVFIILTDKTFKYKSFKEQSTNFLRKTVFGDKQYKDKLRVIHHSEELEHQLSETDIEFDYGLVIRPDYFTISSLEKLKKKCVLFCGYQWDGFKRYPKIIDYITLFDRFFAFDENDYHKHKDFYKNIFPITNFYIDYLPRNPVNNGQVFFLGSYIPERMDQVIKVSDFFNEKGIPSSINVVFHKSKIPEELTQASINLIKKPLSYLEMLDRVSKCGCMLEFHNKEIHEGLSFRVFEALYFKKKLITNNVSVKDYDFFHPNNFFIWNENNTGDIENFLREEYVDMDEHVLRKYSFTNWISIIFNIKPYQAIQNY